MPDSSTMELVNGRIVEKNVSLESSKIEGAFFFRFKAFLLEKPVAEAFPASLGYQCFAEEPLRVRKPDATVVKVERIRALPEPNPGFMPIVPDLAVEVISPKDLAYEVEEKIAEYTRAGFPLLWVANPKSRTVTVYRLGQRPVVFTAADELTAEEVLPGFRCKVADFFSAPAVAPKP
jgi:Uma2 family endonuclease